LVRSLCIYYPLSHLDDDAKQQRAALLACAPIAFAAIAEERKDEIGNSDLDNEQPVTLTIRTTRAEGAIERLGPTITIQSIKKFARTARKQMRIESGGYRRDYLRALTQRVEVDVKELRIMGSKSELLRTLVAASSAKTAGFGVPSFVPKWRTRHDSNV